MTAGETLGPAARPGQRGAWWLVGLAAFLALVGFGFGGGGVNVPLLAAAAMVAVLAYVLSRKVGERCRLTLTESGVRIAGRTSAMDLQWAEIGWIAHAPGGLSGAHLALDFRDGAAGAERAPGVTFPVRAVGAPHEEIVAFLARGAARAGYDLRDADRDMRRRHLWGAPRIWHVVARTE